MGQNEHTILYTFIYTMFFSQKLALERKESENIVNVLCHIAKVFYQSKDVLVVHSKKSKLKQTNQNRHTCTYIHPHRYIDWKKLDRI